MESQGEGTEGQGFISISLHPCQTSRLIKWGKPERTHSVSVAQGLPFPVFTVNPLYHLLPTSLPFAWVVIIIIVVDVVVIWNEGAST